MRGDHTFPAVLGQETGSSGGPSVPNLGWDNQPDVGQPGVQVDFDPVPWGNPTFELVFVAILLLVLVMCADNWGASNGP